MRLNRTAPHTTPPPNNWDTQQTRTCPSCQTPLHPQNTTTLIYTCTNPNPTIHETQYCNKCYKHTWITDRILCPCGHNIQDWATHNQQTTTTSWKTPPTP